MKRLCYLLVLLLTGFTFAANENKTSNQNFYLSCDGQTAQVLKVQLHQNLPGQNRLFKQNQQEQTVLSNTGLPLNQQFICSIK